MPTYDYVCNNCKNRFEAFQRFSEAPLTTCEQCGGELRRVFHPASIQFKGSGFYSTDNRRPGGSVKPKTGEKSGESGSSDGASGQPEKSDGRTKGDSKESGSSAKPAAKTAEKSA